MAAIDPATLTGPGGPLYNMTQAEQTEWLSAYLYGQNKGLSLGPWLMGFAIDMFFMGVVTTQFVRWLSLGHPDRLFTKIVVYTLFVCCVGFSGLSIVYNMRNFVYGFGTYAHFSDMLWIECFVSIAATISTVSQIFYAERTYRLLGPQRALVRNLFLAVLCAAMMLEIGGAFSSIVFVVTQIKTLFDAYKIEPVLYVWLGGQLAADVLITLTTSWVLWQSKTGWSNTDRTIKRLVTFTVETQLPPTLIAFVYMIYYSQNTQGTIIIAFGFSLSKPYVIGLLAMLNERSKIREDMDGTFKTATNNTFPLKGSRHQQATVHVHTETHTHADTYPAQQLPIGINRGPFDDEYDNKELKDTSSDFKTDAGDSRTHLAPL